MTDETRLRVAFVPLESTFIGLPRALLFNMMYRDSVGGKIILRIDDTDSARAQPERLSIILDALRWLGIRWDEGPEQGGPYEPYIQSQRGQIYDHAVKFLLQKGRAYHCFCHNSEGAAGCQNNCASLTKDIVFERLAHGEESCIRFKLLHETEVYTDLIHGNISKEMKDISDPVIMRTNNTPTFHLATAVDEGAFRITHIFRGVDHIESAFVQRQVMEALGIHLPEYMHFSIFVNSNENIYNDNLGDRYNLEKLRNEGFLREAIVNFLITSGYSPRNTLDTTLFTYQDFVDSFDISNFSLSNQAYDFDRLIAINRRWIRGLSNQDYLKEVNNYCHHLGILADYPESVLLEIKQHVDTLAEVIQKCTVLYNNSYEHLRKLCIMVQGSEHILSKIYYNMKSSTEWTPSTVKQAIVSISTDYSVKACYEAVRFALTGNAKLGSIINLTVAVGRDNVLQRFDGLLTIIKQRR